MRRHFERQRALLVAMLAIACSDSPTGRRTGVPAQLEIAGGNGQVGIVGLELPNPLVVKVLDANGRPVRNQLVNFRVTAGAGSVFAGSALTNADGIAQERWTLGTSTQGEQRVEARAVSNNTGAPLVFGTFGATARAGPVASVEVLSGQDQSALAGSALSIAPSVRARDQYANGVPGVSVTFAVTSGNGAVANPTQTTDANGIATAGTWTLGPSEGIQTLTATSGQAAGATISAVARPRTPAQLTVLAGNNQSAVVGAAVTTPPTVLVRNASGDALPGIVVTFAPASGSGSVTGATVTTDALGRASVGSWILGTGAGAQTLSVSAGVLSAEITATATTDAVAGLTVITNPPATAEVASTSTFAVRAVDRFGNPVAGAEVTFEATGGGGSFAPGGVTTAADGTASATWTLGTAAGQNVARARVGSGPSVTVSSNATAGAPTRVVKHAGDNQSATVATAVPVPPAVVVEDRFGNRVPNVTITFVVAAGSGSVGVTAVSGSDGVAATSQWVLGTIATVNTLTASGIGAPAVTFTAIGLPGPVAVLTKVAGDGQVAPVSDAVLLRPAVDVRDAFGNAVPGVSVTFVVTAGGGTVDGGSTTTDQNGLATVGNWIMGSVAGPQELTATADDLTPVTFAAEARNRVASRIVAHPANDISATWGDILAPSVIVLDEFGGPVAGVPVTFAAFGGGGSITGANAVTDVDGIASVGSWRVVSCSGPSTLQANAAGVATPVVIAATVASDGPTRITSDVGISFSLNYSIDGNGNLGLPLPRVRDSCARDLAGVAVTFMTDERSRMDEGDGIDFTDVAGIATKGRWRPSSPGVTTLTVSAVGMKGQILSAQYQATVYHGAPNRLVKIEGDAQSGPAGSTLPVAPRLLVVDRQGNPAPRYITPYGIGGTGLPAGTVSIRFDGLDGGTGQVTLPVNPDGTVTAPLWRLGSTVGTQSVLASNPSSPYEAPISVTFTATATAPPPPPSP